MLTFFTGTTTEVEKLSLHFLPIYSSSGTPHYIVFDKTVRQYGWGGVHSAGFFNFRNRLPGSFQFLSFLFEFYHCSQTQHLRIL